MIGCRYPLWPDGAAPDGRYCGRACAPGRSYCAEHVRVCYVNPDPAKRRGPAPRTHYDALQRALAKAMWSSAWARRLRRGYV